MLHRLKPVAVTAIAALALSACGSSSSSSQAASGSTTSTAATASAVSAIKNAPDLRTKLNILLGEHIVLATKATGAALNGNNDEFTAYGKQLNTNGTDIGALIGAAYGSDAESQFNGIWSAHDGFFVDYTTGVATKDTAKQQKAVSDLTNTYVPQFSKFISDATGLPLATVTDLTTQHVLQTKAIVDAQGKKDWAAAYAAEATAYAHMQMIADPIAAATSTKFPDKFPTSGTKSGADLRVALNSALQAHMYLASFATDAALAGRTDEFKVAGDALNKNGTDLGTAIGGIYGTDAQTQFNSIWSAHNGFFVDYTTGVATKDTAAQTKAVTNLTTVYVPQFTDFVVGATGLDKATVTSLITEHVTMTKDVVDAQASKSWSDVGTKDRASAQHMQSIADALTSGIIAKNPAKFSA